MIVGEKKAFTDGDCLEDCGIKIDPNATKVFDVLFTRM